MSLDPIPENNISIDNELHDLSEEHFDIDKEKLENVKLNLSISESDDMIIINSDLIVDGMSFQGTYVGEANFFKNNEEIFIYGPMFGETDKLDSEDKLESIITLYYNVTNNHASVTYTSGNLYDGVSMLMFGSLSEADELNIEKAFNELQTQEEEQPINSLNIEHDVDSELSILSSGSYTNYSSPGVSTLHNMINGELNRENIPSGYNNAGRLVGRTNISRATYGAGRHQLRIQIL